MQDGTIVFAGGGTGGHLFPGIAVAEELARRDDSLRIIFAGTRKPIEQTILHGTTFGYQSIDAAPSTMLKRNPGKFLWRYARARRQAKQMLRRLRARAVVGLGGYASVPVVLAARSLRIPTVLLEQNIVAGRANRWLSRRADLVCHAFAEAVASTPRARADRLRVTGNPVRREIANLATATRRTTGKPTLLILGGSQGASAVNSAVCATAEELAVSLRNWRIVHQTGQRDAETVRACYTRHGIEHRVEPFFSNMVELYQAADLAISRAGATSLAELACCGLPAILIPIPHSLRDHQAKNAEHYENANAAVVVRQGADSQQTAGVLLSPLRRLIEQDAIRKRMGDAMRTLGRPSAAADVAGLIGRLIGEKQLPAGRALATHRRGMRARAG